MNKYKNLIFVMVVALILGACAKPETPTNIQIAEGEWAVENVIANGELNPNSYYQVESVLHLDRNETFLFVNVDGRATAGTWTATESNLTLTGTSPEDYVQNYTIASLTWDKMHVYRTFSILGNEVEIRYLFRRIR